MKTILLTLFIVVTIMTVVSSAVSAQSTLRGAWNLDANSVESDLRAEDKETLSKLPAQKRIEVIRELGSRIFSFFEDGSFQAEWSSGGQAQKLEGRWHVEGNRLFIDSDTGTKSYEILIFNEERLVLVPDAKVGFFQKLVFIKSEQ